MDSLANSTPATLVRSGPLLADPSRDLATPATNAVLGLPNGQRADVVQRLREVIEQALARQACAAGDVASELGVCTRTLNRRLRAGGTSFAREIAAARFSLAQTLLRETSLRLTDVAQELAYSDSSAFTRAFKRHAGMTPSEFRARARAIAARASVTPPCSRPASALRAGR